MNVATAIVFYLLSPLPFGKTVLHETVTPEAAKKMAASPECRKQRKAAKDKFAGIERSHLGGACWALEQIAGATKPGKAPSFDNLRRTEVLPPDVLPVTKEGDKTTATLRNNTIVIEALTRESGFRTGNQTVLRPLVAADFTGGGRSELLLWVSKSAIGATFEECEVVILQRQVRRFVVVRKKALGRCG